MLLTASTPLLLLEISLGQHLLGHVQLGPHTHALHHVVRLGHPQLQGLAATLGHADDLRMGQVQDVDPVDGEEDVPDSQAGGLGRGAGLDGGHHHWAGAVDTETKLALHSLHSDSLVAFCNISISRYNFGETSHPEVEDKTKDITWVSFEMSYGVLY